MNNDKLKNNSKGLGNKDDTMRDILIMHANSETIQRYGEATYIYIKGYTGWEDPNTGKFSKGLKQVASSKVNPQYKYANEKQQSGFSAEIEYTSKKNAENAKKGRRTRYRRSNDAGRGNDEQYDVGKVNKEGTFVEDADGTVQDGVQMKFSGGDESPEKIKKSADANVRKMVGKGKWKRYKKIAVPSEQYDEMREYAKQKADSLSEQAKKCRKEGNTAKADELEAKAKEYREARRKIKNSGISSKEAMDARKHPVRTTIKHIGRTAHEAGLKQAEAGALIGGAISAAQNIMSIYKDNKDVKTALKNVAVDTGKSAAASYSVTFASTTLKGFMESSKNGTINALSKSNVPVAIVTGVIQVEKSFRRYINGEINELELAEELGEKGVGSLAAGWGAALGSIVCPGVGTMLGGTIGYMVSSILYEGAMKVYSDEKLSLERRLQIHAFVEQAIQAMNEEKLKIEQLITLRYSKRAKIFANSFAEIETAIKDEDCDKFIEGLNNITKEMGATLQFKTFKEFDDFMLNPKTELEF